MKTYYIRTRKSEIVIDSDVTNGGFGPFNKEKLKEVLEVMLEGSACTAQKVRKEERNEKELMEYLCELEKEKSIKLNIKGVDREKISLRSRAKNRPIEDEIEVGTFN